MKKFLLYFETTVGIVSVVLTLVLSFGKILSTLAFAFFGVFGGAFLSILGAGYSNGVIVEEGIEMAEKVSNSILGIIGTLIFYVIGIYISIRLLVSFFKRRSTTKYLKYQILSLGIITPTKVGFVYKILQNNLEDGVWLIILIVHYVAVVISLMIVYFDNNGKPDCLKMLGISTLPLSIGVFSYYIITMRLNTFFTYWNNVGDSEKVLIDWFASSILAFVGLVVSLIFANDYSMELYKKRKSFIFQALLPVFFNISYVNGI